VHFDVQRLAGLGVRQGIQPLVEHRREFRER